MSLVMAAISKRSRNFLHSASISAVLPEPTGPPTPTRSGPWDVDMRQLPSAANAGTLMPCRSDGRNAHGVAERIENAVARLLLGLAVPLVHGERRRSVEHVRHDVKSERAIGLELLLAEELIAGRLVRKIRIAPLVVEHIVALVAGQRGLHVKQDTGLVRTVADFAGRAMRPGSGRQRLGFVV